MLPSSSSRMPSVKKSGHLPPISSDAILRPLTWRWHFSPCKAATLHRKFPRANAPSLPERPCLRRSTVHKPRFNRRSGKSNSPLLLIARRRFWRLGHPPSPATLSLAHCLKRETAKRLSNCFPDWRRLTSTHRRHLIGGRVVLRG